MAQSMPVTKRVSFRVLLWSTLHFSNAVGNAVQSTSVTLQKNPTTLVTFPYLLHLTHTTCSAGAFGLLQNAPLLDSEQKTRFHPLCINPIKNSLLKAQQFLWNNYHLINYLSSSNKNDSAVKTAQKNIPHHRHPNRQCSEPVVFYY